MSLSIGIDIAKEKMDIFFNGTYAVIKNNAKEIQSFFKHFDNTTRIALEATGKYHRLAHKTLVEMGFQVMVINPYQSKHFAKAMNLLCKTDKVDAKILSLFAEKMDFKPTPYARATQQELQDLSRHLDDLKKLKIDLELRKRDANGFIAGSLKSATNAIEKEIKKTEEELNAVINKDETTQKRLALLTTIPGVGKTTGISLLSYLKELGSVNKREIAALAGLAPVNNESGTFTGKRRIRGGRHDVRSQLYMPTLGAATQHNKSLNALYQKLVSKGKPKKVAITACMRKLVIWANSILISGQPWVENHAKNY